MYTIELLDAAIEDFKNAVAWYEEQKRGLGFDFTVELADVFESIESAPESQRFLYENRRFAFVRQFPYKIYFLVDEPNLRVVVFAILHNKRDPQVWKKRDKGLGI